MLLLVVAKFNTYTYAPDIVGSVEKNDVRILDNSHWILCYNVDTGIHVPVSGFPRVLGEISTHLEKLVSYGLSVVDCCRRTQTLALKIINDVGGGRHQRVRNSLSTTIKIRIWVKDDSVFFVNLARDLNNNANDFFQAKGYWPNYL